MSVVFASALGKLTRSGTSVSLAAAIAGDPAIMIAVARGTMHNGLRRKAGVVRGS
jgi:hypothetical protein